MMIENVLLIYERNDLRIANLQNNNPNHERQQNNNNKKI